MPDRHPSSDGRLARHCREECEAIPPARRYDARATGIRRGDRPHLCRRYRARKAQSVCSGSGQDREGARHRTRRTAATRLISLHTRRSMCRPIPSGAGKRQSQSCRHAPTDRFRCRAAPHLKLRAISSESRARSNRNGARDDLGIRTMARTMRKRPAQSSPWRPPMLATGLCLAMRPMRGPLLFWPASKRIDQPAGADPRSPSSGTRWGNEWGNSRIKSSKN